MTECELDRVKCCGLYIDAENLQEDAQKLVKVLLDDWPTEKAPHPSRVNLYVRADTVELWNAWTARRGGTIGFEVKGIQHFSRQQSALHQKSRFRGTFGASLSDTPNLPQKSATRPPLELSSAPKTLGSLQSKAP